MARKHAYLSPSSAHRWTVCPGSWALEAHAPDGETAYSAEGTRLHDIVAKCIEEKTVCPSSESQDIQDAVNFCVDYARLVEQNGSMILEQAVPLQKYTGEKDAEGFADCIVYNDSDMWIVDWKFGQGVKVTAKNNPQIALYALGALEMVSAFTEIKEVHLVIVQPFLDHVSQWDMSTDALKNQGRVLKAKASVCRAQKYLPLDELSLIPQEDACKFCKAKASCPALQALASEAMDKDVPTMNGDALGYWMDKTPMLTSFVKAVEGEVFRRLSAGEDVNGWKLVAGRGGIRSWSDEGKALEILTPILGEQATVTKAISVAQAEKFAKAKKGQQPLIDKAVWQDIQQCVKVPLPKPTLARFDDPRETWVDPEAANEADFNDVEVVNE